MANSKRKSSGRLKKAFTYNGKRYYVYGYSKKELEEKAFRKRQELEAGKERRENPTLNEYHETWITARIDTIKQSTLHSQLCQYKACSNVEIKTAGRKLGDLKLSEINVDDIREVQRSLRAEGRTTQTTNDTIAHLSHIFKTAMDERRIDYNPCKLVKPLKRTEEHARDTTHRALSKEETEAFFKAAEGSYYYDVFRFAINTGLRCGEIGALYETDIKDGLITVERTITRLANGKYEIGDSAKTKHGRRTIPVNNAISEILDHQREINSILDSKNIVPIQDRIFKAPERGLLMATPIDREIKRICKRAGIEYFTMHAFRATFATRLIEQGINPRTIQELLGHADFSITMNLYGHVLDDTKKEAMNNISIAI